MMIEFGFYKEEALIDILANRGHRLRDLSYDEAKEKF